MSSPASSSAAPGSLSRYNSNVTQHTVADADMSFEDALSRLEIENRLKEGAENLLQVLDTRTRERPKEAREARRLQVMAELNQTNARIAILKSKIEELADNHTPSKLYKRQRSDEMLGSRPKLATIKSYSSSKQGGLDEVPPRSINEIVTNLGESGRDSAEYIVLANDLVKLMQRHASTFLEIPRVKLTACLLRLFSSTSSNMIAAGYRIARYMVQDVESADHVLSIGTERCLVVSLSRDQRVAMEREQAIKLIRRIAIVANKSLTAALMRALIAVAESDDRLSFIGLETLAEILVRNPGIMAKTGGIRCLLDNLIEGSASLSDELVMALVYTLDYPSTRGHLKAGKDIEVIFAPFTEYVEGKRLAASEERLLTSTTVVARMLDSWPGLLTLSMYDFQGIRSIIDALRVPSSMVRESILDFLFHALSIPVNNMTSTFLAGRRLTTLGRIPISAETASAKAARTTRTARKKSNLLNQFSAMKLSLFLEAGLLDGVMMVVEDKSDLQASRKATLLVGEVLQLANSLLPLSKCRTLQSLPRLFKSATEMQSISRFGATSALFQIESLNRTRNKANMARIVNSVDNSNTKRGQRQVEQVKIKMGLQIDDSHFRNLLLDTQVLSTKNYTKWHWDTLTELVEGPLLNPKRLEESIRATKFMKRLLAFYRPFTHRFSAIKNTKPSQRYVRFGCLLLNTLLANPEGVKYLTESKLLRQLSECLAQMDPMNQVTASDALFSRDRLEETLCHGYFELLGTLTSHPQGVAMMERWRMFSSLYHLTDLRSRGDLVKLFLKHMDYSYEGHPRIIISKALTTSLLDVRLFATQHLGFLIDESMDRTRKTVEWAIRLLVIQLYDPNTEVCEAAVNVLEAACNTREHLEYIVSLRPALDHLGEVGAPLLLRFLATSIGFHYLEELNYIGREMDDWLHGRDDEYVTLIEATLLQAHAPLVHQRSNLFDGITPAHFYGELAKTAEGVELLLQGGHLSKYISFLHSHWDTEDATTVLKVKAALWAIGNIGATERGAPFLRDSKVTASIVKIAEQSLVATLKGTAYLVLGMLSATAAGVDLLQLYGWHGVLTNMGAPTGICVPDRVSSVLNLTPWPYALSDDKIEDDFQSLHDPIMIEITRAMADLGNHILANDAAKTLVRLRQKYSNTFLSPVLYEHAFRLLATYSYRLGVRKFILELFSTDVLIAYLQRINQTTRMTRGYSLPKDLSKKIMHEVRQQAQRSHSSGRSQSKLTERDDSSREEDSTPRPTRTRSHRSATVQ